MNQVGVLKCENFNIDSINLTFNKMTSGKMLYPMYNVKNETGNNPILIQTPFVWLHKSPILNGNGNGNGTVLEDTKWFNLYQHPKGNNNELNQIFNVFSQLDEETEKNLPKIIKTDDRIKPDVQYVKCVKGIAGAYQHLKFKLNFSIASSEEAVDKVDKENKEKPPVKKLLPVIKVFYKSNFSNSRYKIHQKSELGKVLKANSKMRFILSVNKIWFMDSMIGYGIKLMQIEIDDTFMDKFKFLKSIKNNEENMFDKVNNTYQQSRDKYQEFLDRKIKYGATRKQKQNENKRIIKLINETADTFIFNDKDEEFPEFDKLSVQI